MFKLLLTLLKGDIHAARDMMADTQALPLLDQQIREAAACHEQGRRALALAVAAAKQEAAQHDALGTRIAGLEVRARAALATGQEALALDVAGMIAALEQERAGAAEAAARLWQELGKLREANVVTARRLAELQRGRQMAALGGALQAARQTNLGTAPLEAAEATLTRLRARQDMQALADEAYTESSTGGLEQKLATAGCGPALRQTAESVLARLRQPRLPQP
jgi:phage shock protein A